MRITRIETIQLKEHPQVLWVQVYTDGGLVGFQGLVLDGQVDVAGDSFHGRGTAQNYDTLGAPVGSPFELTVEATRIRVD